jgi:hypothetical protein
MDSLQQQTHLYGLAEYRKLDARYQKIAREVLLNGLSFSAACKPLGTNPSRAKANVDLQKCFWAFNRPTSDPSQPPTAAGEISIYDQAAALEKEMESWSPEKLAEWHERMEREYPRDKNWPCHVCGKSCDRAIGLCPACCPGCRCNSADCPRNPKCRESKPTPLPRAVSAPNTPVSKRCRTCGLPAGPRDIVCSDPTCVGAVDTF